MDGRARNLDIFKTIVLLYFIAFIFFRFIYGITQKSGVAVSQFQPANQPIATLELAPTVAVDARPAANEPVTSPPLAAAVSAPSGIPDCPFAAPARISGVGARVRVTNALIPLRTKPSVSSSSFLGPLPIGTELEVISMPVCEAYLEGANLWWQVRTLSGKVGWAAEASAIKPIFYYLEEIK